MDSSLTAAEPLGTVLGGIKVLDHGHVRLVDTMGDDSAVVQAARVSYGAGTKSVSEDRGLIRYLLKHQHTTPFEMCEIKLHCKMPLFVARQWVRHRTASINEMSARYSILPGEFYVPKVDQLQYQDTNNAQGRSGEMSNDDAGFTLDTILQQNKNAYEAYERLLTVGTARELARMVLPTNIYTEWYWKVDVHNLMNFLRLRADSHAQYEIRVYAEAICKIFKSWMPITYEAFEDYILNAESLSAMEVGLVSKTLPWDGHYKLAKGFVHEDMTKREVDEFRNKFGQRDFD